MSKGAWSNGAVDPVGRQNFVGKLPTWFYMIWEEKYVCYWIEDKNDKALFLLHFVSLDWEEKTEAARVWNTLRLCSRLPHCLHLQFGMERICKKNCTWLNLHFPCSPPFESEVLSVFAKHRPQFSNRVFQIFFFSIAILFVFWPTAAKWWIDTPQHNTTSLKFKDP